MKPPPSNIPDNEAERIAYLVAGYVNKTLTNAEHDELDAWVEASDENMKLFEELTDEDTLRKNLEWMKSIDTGAALKKVSRKVGFSHRKSNKIPYYWLYGVAASILVAFVLWQVLKTHGDDRLQHPEANTTKEIFPADPRITLTLSNGQVISPADSQATVSITDGKAILYAGTEGLSYKNNNDQPGIAFHRLQTAAGSTYRVTLADGTNVWLNAGSALRYPVTFGNDKRLVELEGEGFFEVAKNGTPFIVMLADSSTITVTGTQFNANAYPDEGSTAITLTEGSVSVTKLTAYINLSPGEQAHVNGNRITKMRVDIDPVIGWKNDLFIFRNTGIEDIFKQVKRWYDVQVVFQRNITEQFNGSISRKEPLSKLLHLLSLTGKVRFKTENNTVYVL